MENRHHTDVIVIHCSATSPFLDIGAGEIRTLHSSPKGEMVPWNGGQMPAFGWDDIGYHYVVRRDGRVERGRDINAIGAHVKGYNSVSIGICLIGGGDGKFDFTKGQMWSLEKLITATLGVFPHAAVRGHNDYTKYKTCPNFDVKMWWYNGLWQG